MLAERPLSPSGSARYWTCGGSGQVTILRLQGGNILLESTQCSKSSVDYVEVLL